MTTRDTAKDNTGIGQCAIDMADYFKANRAWQAVIGSCTVKINLIRGASDFSQKINQLSALAMFAATQYKGNWAGHVFTVAFDCI